MKQNRLILALTATLLFFGGLGAERTLVLVSGFFIGITSVLYIYLKNRRIILPYGFVYFAAFLLLAVLSQIWSRIPQNGVEYLILFAAGGLFWLFFYNLKPARNFTEIFGWSLTILGIVFAFIYLISLLLNEKLTWSFSLSAPYTHNHHHLGDYWVLPLLFLLTKIVKEKKLMYFLLILLGISILAFSLSRSSYVSLALGAFIIFYKEVSPRIKSALKRVVIFSAIIFLLTSLFKTTLYSRIYFLQGFLGIIKHPLGVGLGNFSIVSKEFVRTFSSQFIFSSLAHNIFLEVLVGIGILGATFLYWYYRVSKNLLKNTSQKALYAGIFFALSANFFFDTTYVIPTMLWSWFMALGLAQKSNA